MDMKQTNIQKLLDIDRDRDRDRQKDREKQTGTDRNRKIQRETGNKLRGS